jgi:hypothetical protein
MTAHAKQYEMPSKIPAYAPIVHILFHRSRPCPVVIATWGQDCARDHRGDRWVDYSLPYVNTPLRSINSRHTV